MVEKIGPIKNPLTIIGIFAGIAEIGGNGVLPFLSPVNQGIYIWFLIVFPSVLVGMFFLTLNFNHTVLYAPSDYKNEDNFLRSLPRATSYEKAQKIEAEINEETLEPLTDIQHKKPYVKVAEGPTKVDGVGVTISSHNLLRLSLLAEDLVLRKLGKEFSSEIQREVKVGNRGIRYIFDGIVRDKGVTTVIEIKFLPNSLRSSKKLIDSLMNIQQAIRLLPNEQTNNLRVLLAIVNDNDTATQESISARIDSYRNEFSFPIEIRFYNMDQLMMESNIFP